MNWMTMKELLDSAYEQYNTSYLSMDPLELVRRYQDPMDQEVAAFLAAAMALGQYRLIRNALDHLLSLMGRSPYQFVLKYHADLDSELFGSFVYRFYRGDDIQLLIHWMQKIYVKWGSLENLFLQGFHQDDVHIGPALSAFVRFILSQEIPSFFEGLLPRGKGIRHFLSSPEDGSACKRLNLFLRWVVRHDTLDLGIWRRVPPSMLIIPVDTHISRISRQLGLTKRKTADWVMAEEITKSLRMLNPSDPVRYDFALCTIGKLVNCPAGRQKGSCKDCPINSQCVSVKEEQLDGKSK